MEKKQDCKKREPPLILVRAVWPPRMCSGQALTAVVAGRRGMHWLIPLYSLREPQTKTILLFLSLIKEVLTPLFRKMKCSFCASRLIISCVNPPPDCLIPTEYLTKSLKSLALYLAQGIMGGINIHRHDLVFIILEMEREVHALQREGWRVGDREEKTV